MSQRPFLPPLSFTPPVSFNLSQLGSRKEQKLPVDSLPALWQHAARMSASENKLSFTRAALKAVACQHFLSVTRSFTRDLVECRDVLLAGGKGAMHYQFEEDCYV